VIEYDLAPPVFKLSGNSVIGTNRTDAIVSLTRTYHDLL
jgi:hypothetical protein